MSIDWNALRDFDGSGDAISDEVLTLPGSYEVFPEFWPQKNSPTSTELWTGAGKTGRQLTEKTTVGSVATSGDYHVDYLRGGLLTTKAGNFGTPLYFSYFETGTFDRVKYLNSIRNVVGSGDVADVTGNVNLVSHANADALHVSNVTLDYFFTDTLEGVISNYYDMLEAPTGEVESSISNAGLSGGNGQLLASFITPVGDPGVNQLEAGVYNGHFHAEKTAGTRVVNIYWALSKRTTGGVETLLMTSEVSTPVTAKTPYDLHASSNDSIDLDSTDRLVLKVYGNLSATPASGTTVVIYQEGALDSHVSIQTTIAGLENVFIRQSLFDAKGDIMGASADNEPTILPPNQPDGHVLSRDAASPVGLKWANASGDGAWSSGDVIGPSSATPNGVPLFSDESGRTLKNSVLIVDDSGNVVGMGTLGCGAITSTGTSGFGTVGLTGALRLNATNKVIFDHNVSAHTYIQEVANDELYFVVGNAAALKMAGANSQFYGNVGIGVAPATKLHAQGASTTIFRLERTGANAALCDFTVVNENLYFSGTVTPMQIEMDTGLVDMNYDLNVAGTTINMVTSGTTLTVGVGADNGTVSAGVFTDRTKFYEGDAVAALCGISGKDGQLDHATMPEFIKANVKHDIFESVEKKKDGKTIIESVKVGEEVVVERDLGATASMLIVATQQSASERATMQGEIDTLKAEIAELRKLIAP